MGKLEDAIYDNYRIALQEGNFDQAKKAAELGRIIRDYMESNEFVDYSSYKTPVSQILGQYFNPFPYKYNFETAIVELDSTIIRLTESENRLFSLLSQNETRGKDIRIITKEQIINHMWGGRAYSKSSIRIAIYRLRLKIEPDPKVPQILINIPPKGYAFLGNMI